MRKIGNLTSNKKFNPRNTRPPVPLDVDEVDSAMERFIRQKYEQMAYTSETSRTPAMPTHTGGTVSSDDQPPPPPPKPTKRFGFGLRSSSSAFPLGKSSRAPAPIQVSKPRVFGASIGVSEDGMEWKLVALKEMGFKDEKRNSSILKGLNGDLERAIESLVRLGEGAGPTTKMPPATTSFDEKRVATPTSVARPQLRSASGQLPSQSSSQWQTQAQKTGTVSPPESTSSYNPFENITPSSAQIQQSNFESAFQNMNIGQSQPQNLFPNATGGYPQHQEQHMRLQQSMTPPIPQLPQQYLYNNPYAQQQQTNSNPFVNAAPVPVIQTPTSANPFLNTQQSPGMHNPFMNQQNVFPAAAVQSPVNQVQYQQTIPNPWLQQQQLQTQIQQSQQQIHQSPAQYFNSQSFSPMVSSPMANGIISGQMPFSGMYQSHTMPLVAQPTGRVDKSSILALYNYPQLAPQPTIPESSEPSQVPTAVPQNNIAARMPVASPQRSVTMPVSGSKNPFLSSGGPMAQPAMNTNHGARESIDSGRHSPDAFASLSARFVR